MQDMHEPSNDKPIKTIEFQQASPLHAAIAKNNLQSVKDILCSFDAKELKQELIYKSSLGLALNADHTKRIATFILRYVLDPERTEDPSIPSWFELFEMTERFYKYFQAKLTSKRLALVLSTGLAHYIASGELKLNELVTRPKFFKAAYILGAKYFPQYHGDSFASHVYHSSIFKSRQKRELYEWMWAVVMYPEHPFSLKIQAELILRITKRRSVPQFFQYIIALSLTEESDENGCNLLHYAADRKDPSAFYGAIFFLLKQGRTEDRVIDMLLEENNRGIIPLAIGLIIYMHASIQWVVQGLGWTTASVLAAAIRRLVRTGDLIRIKPVFESYILRSCKPFVYYLHSLGLTSELVSSVFGDKYSDIFDEAMTTHVSYRISRETKGQLCTDESFDLNNLLPELVYEIALHLSPDDMFNLFLATSRTARLLRRSNDRFWKRYYALHYRRVHTVHAPLRQQVIQDIRVRQNRQSKHYHEIEIQDCRLATLDENWMVFVATNKFASYYGDNMQHSTFFFNCHTQQRHSGITNTAEPVHPELILSDHSYGTGRDPVYFGEHIAKKSYNIIRDRKLLECRAIGEFLNDRPLYFSTKYAAVDRRMFISERCAIYDIDYDKIVGTLPGATKFHYRSSTNTYLPASRQIYAHNATINAVELFDLNYNRVASLPPNPSLYDIPYQVDEHTLFYALHSGFLDLRTHRFIRAFSGAGTRASVVSVDAQRIVFAHGTLCVLTSWNLATRQWEFVDDNWFIPCAANSRYLVGKTETGEVIMRDYCGTAKLN